MDETIDELLIDVRATTDGFASDVAAMRNSLDTNLLDGFERAGTQLEKGLLKAIRAGGLGFQDLKRMAFQAFEEIAAHALNSGIGAILGGSQSGNGGALGNILGTVLGLPGRATGGPVSPGRGFIVGERGPELFVPTSAGRVETLQPAIGAVRDVKVAVQLAAPRGSSAPVALQRSSRQIASAVRHALQNG